MDETVIFLCDRCGVQVTEPVRHLEDLGALSEETGDYEIHGELVFAGHYILSDELAAAKLDRSPEEYGPPGEVILNTSNLIRHPSKHNPRDVGCCGYDGDAGYNVFCQLGHAVGTEVTDCCTVNYAHLPLALLRRQVGDAPHAEPMRLAVRRAARRNEMWLWIIATALGALAWFLWLAHLNPR